MRAMSTLVIAGARVWTDDGAGSIRFEPRTIWIRDGRIVDVLPGVAPPAGARPDVAVFDASGRFVCPAFVDAHFHLIALANKQLRVDLSAATSAREVVHRMAAALESVALVGVDFDESDWRDAALPTRTDLNGITATTPVYARRVCCHVGVANDALLRALAPRVDARFIDRESGRITEDAVFEANRLTKPPDEMVALALDGAVAHLHSLGIAAIGDIVDPDTVEVYGAGLRASRRALRIDAYLHLPAHAFEAARAGFDTIDPGRVRAVGIKIFSDGSMGGHTAAMHERYADADTRGHLLVTRASLAHEFAACEAQGIACAVHAIGDRALSTVLDAVEDCPGARVRIEHAEVIAERDVERIVRLGLPLVMQPNFVRNWGGEGGLYERRLGRSRWERNNPFATLARAGARVVFSSDGMPAGPLFGMRGATHHPVARECIGAVDAFRHYMTDAHAMWGGGTPAVRAGELADLVVLSGNPLITDTDRQNVEATFVGGNEVYRSPRMDPRSNSKRTR